jgi:RNA polymerase sigma-70 factor (ECF subfamily)
VETRLSPFRPEQQDSLCGGVPFGTLVEEHWDAVYRLLYRMTGSTHDAEDLAQETFLRALKRRDSLRPGTNARAWLMRIASNALIDLGRKRKTERTRAADPVELETHPAAAQADTAQGRELHAALEAALAVLPETQRLVFLLRVQENQSFQQIAEALELAEATARWHMLQARRQLMEKMKDQEEGTGRQ